ncbi:hypothetical protein [Streptomyces aurantiogriseus]|uniref:Uncharacterized protein n=1 Tax=Streptomyces aurantiogriseus TaxID=66870 RepID=A0A918C6Q4_9ACTN|nr:hypothetical protein [Streptomyces aurantiogriseus]GGR06483.1 hypothetical protein GCM10010251_22810 [Streptomyces aurantiogriseus]
MSPPRLPLTRALVDVLAAGTGRPCGLTVLPRATDGRPAAYPYLILDSLPGEFSGPSFADWHADVAWTYQATSVGERADQVQWLGDRVRDVLFDRAPGGWRTDIPVAGMQVIGRELSYDADGEAVDGSQGSIVTYVQRFTITVTPAA